VNFLNEKFYYEGEFGMSKLTFAIQMEMDGEQYYASQAEINKGTALYHAFILLAEAEKKHADLLRKKFIDSDSSINDNLTTTESATLFSGKADYMRDDDAVPDQLEVYTVARDMEQKSIDLYREMLTETKDEPNRKLFEFLIKQEQDHYAFFDELITLLRRPREWVEDAEFGPNKEY
jgi:rubrerythrin